MTAPDKDSGSAPAPLLERHAQALERWAAGHPIDRAALTRALSALCSDLELARARHALEQDWPAAAFDALVRS